MHSDQVSEEDDRQALFDALLAGNSRAFDRAFVLLRPLIHSVVRADVNAADIVNETFLVLHLRIQAGTIASAGRHPDPTNAQLVLIRDWNGLTRWLKQVARYTQRGYWRKHLARRVDPERPSNACSADEDLYQCRDSLMTVMEYVAEHEPAKLWLLQSKFIHGLTWEEIARDVRFTTLGAAKMAVSRLCRSIRREFENAV